MTRFLELKAARELLELGQTADMKSIKASYRRLLTKWHPDRNGQNREICHKKTQEIILAYRIIEEYCTNYQFSFTEDSVKRHLSPEQWWAERFGMNPDWPENGR
jgi:DnaJ-class molecular chaperone